MTLIKKLVLSTCVSFVIATVSPVVMAAPTGKIENASIEEVRQALVDTVKATEQAIASLKEGEGDDKINDHISNARQYVKRVEINRLDVIRTRAAENLKKAKTALNNGDKAGAEENLGIALKSFLDMQKQF
jgi:hypothetical protein